MRLFEFIYLTLLSGSIIKWLLTAKDFATALTAITLGILTCIYMYYKGRDMRASAKIKEKKLKDNG